MDDKMQKKNFFEVSPLCDVVEAEDKATVWFEVPGASSKTVKVEVQNSILNVEAESSLIRHGKPVLFKRSFQLSDSVEINQISAKTADGVLTLILPKAQNARIHKVAVE